MEDITVDIEFSGGAELLFNNVKNHEVKIPCPSGSQIMMSDLLVWIRDNLLQGRPDLFMQGNTVRPGILVLINDTDWLLAGELNYPIQQNDKIVFISTLHGG